MFRARAGSFADNDTASDRRPPQGERATRGFVFPGGGGGGVTSRQRRRCLSRSSSRRPDENGAGCESSDVEHGVKLRRSCDPSRRSGVDCLDYRCSFRE